MQRYIVRRLIHGLITLWVLTLVIFFLARATGNPADLMVAPEASAEERTRVVQVLGLDQPYPVQYYQFIKNMVKGDFGKSIRMKMPVRQLFFQRLPNTMRLAAAAMGIAVMIALPLGVIAAVRRGSYVDKVAQAVAVMGMSAPAFWVGLVLMQLMAVKLRLLPVAGIGGIQNYILPAFTLGIFFVAGLFRLTRSSMLDVLDSEYVKLARIKGVPENLVIWKHCFRNALVPILSFASVYFAVLISGAIVVETVFAWPGVGRLSYEAIMGRDYPVMQAVVIMVASLILVVNLLVDILYAYIDPRIRYG